MAKPRTINVPQKSEKLAEFVGIMLGDGSICRTNYEVQITSHSIHEKLYQDHIEILLKDLFGIKGRRVTIKNRDTVYNRINSIKLFEFLKSIDMPIGDKGKYIPSWIFENDEWMKACVRGLIDSDGSLFLSSRHCILNFTSYYPQLLSDFTKCMDLLGVKYYITPKRQDVNITALRDIKKIMETCGSSNPKHIIKFQEYINNKRTIRSKDLITELEKYKGVVVQLGKTHPWGLEPIWV